MRIAWNIFQRKTIVNSDLCDWEFAGYAHIDILTALSMTKFLLRATQSDEVNITISIFTAKKRTRLIYYPQLNSLEC